MNKKPMPLQEFLHKIGELAKLGKWTAYKEAVRRRNEYFKNNPKEGKF